MAEVPGRIDIEVHTIHTEARSPAVVIVKGISQNEHTTQLLNELSEQTGCMVFGLERGVDLQELTDEDLTRVGLQRIDKIAKED